MVNPVQDAAVAEADAAGVWAKCTVGRVPLYCTDSPPHPLDYAPLVPGALMTKPGYSTASQIYGFSDIWLALGVATTLWYFSPARVSARFV